MGGVGSGGKRDGVGIGLNEMGMSEGDIGGGGEGDGLEYGICQ